MAVIEGFCWLVHHNILLEWCYDYDKRQKIIRSTKLKNEIPVRLRWMQMVKGKIPQALISLAKAVDEAKKAVDEAKKAYVEAWKACDEATKAYEKEVPKHKDYLEKLHAQECPGCPWNGEILVFGD